MAYFSSGAPSTRWPSRRCRLASRAQAPSRPEGPARTTRGGGAQRSALTAPSTAQDLAVWWPRRLALGGSDDRAGLGQGTRWKPVIGRWNRREVLFLDRRGSAAQQTRAATGWTSIDPPPGPLPCSASSHMSAELRSGGTERRPCALPSSRQPFEPQVLARRAPPHRGPSAALGASRQPAFGGGTLLPGPSSPLLGAIGARSQTRKGLQVLEVVRQFDALDPAAPASQCVARNG